MPSDAATTTLQWLASCIKSWAGKGDKYIRDLGAPSADGGIFCTFRGRVSTGQTPIAISLIRYT